MATIQPHLLADLDDADHVRCLGETAWHTVRELRAGIRVAENDRTSTPPDPYALGLKKLCAANAAPLSTFEQRWKAARLADVEATRRALAADEPAQRMTAAELAPWAAPDGYAASLRKIQEKP